ncbi:Hypothetical_protein [Hexamita inflata]|uniref:Hypothetical_protein n=1 Tax=Hexamita inflata TaxID=28002 RepID=A0AA86UU37_9EUKA|nr:Hypothetical protein HINF_LOCUS52532 [Hexamita inflata]
MQSSKRLCFIAFHVLEQKLKNQKPDQNSSLVLCLLRTTKTRTICVVALVIWAGQICALVSLNTHQQLHSKITVLIQQAFQSSQHFQLLFHCQQITSQWTPLIGRLENTGSQSITEEKVERISPKLLWNRTGTKKQLCNNCFQRQECA